MSRVFYIYFVPVESKTFQNSAIDVSDTSVTSAGHMTVEAVLMTRHLLFFQNLSFERKENQYFFVNYVADQFAIY